MLIMLTLLMLKLVQKHQSVNIMISIQSIADKITALFEKSRPALTPIPALIMLCSLMQRPGLSAALIAAAIIRRQSEAGAPTGALPDGSRNVAEAMEVVRVEEILKALKQNAKIEVVVPPGAITITATGANGGGPVTVMGTNINATNITGLIR